MQNGRRSKGVEQLGTTDTDDTFRKSALHRICYDLIISSRFLGILALRPHLPHLKGVSVVGGGETTVLRHTSVSVDGQMFLKCDTIAPAQFERVVRATEIEHSKLDSMQPYKSGGLR